MTTPVNKANVESLDVTTTNIQLRKQYSDITVANSGFTSPTAGKDLFFQPFDERYLISYDDGSIERDSKSIYQSRRFEDSYFYSLSKSSGKGNLFATVLKSNVRNKSKLLNEANVLVINRSKLASSGIGTNTLNDGLTNSRVYGTRVQDRQISLNVPEGIEALGVFESNDVRIPIFQVSLLVHILDQVETTVI